MPGIVEDDFHGATAPGAAEINTLIAVVGPGGNYLPVHMSYVPGNIHTHSPQFTWHLHFNPFFQRPGK